MTRIRHSLTAAATAVLLAPGVATASTTDSPNDAQLLLLLDSSGSMEDPDAEGEPKIDAAKAAVGTLVDGLNPDQQVGVRLFGGSVPLDEPREDKCADSELVVPIGSGNTDAMRDAVEAYQPLGETPIAYALQQAADDLGEEGNRTILLVSDGIATCDPDPCEVAEELTADGFDLVVHTVGLGVDQETRDQLECVADVAGGTYYDADDTDTLTTALTRISTRAFRPFQLSGEPVTGTVDPAQAPVLDVGRYVDEVGEEPLSYRVRRTLSQSTLHVSGTLRPDDDTGMSALNLVLETPDGRSCDLSAFAVWTAGSGDTFGSGSVNGVPASYRECGDVDELVLRVEQQSGARLAGQTIEIVVHEEPAPQDPAALPDADARPEWQDLAPGEPTASVVGGTSFNDPPTLEPGATYTSDIVPGEVLVFAVPVGWGQHLQALVDVPVPEEGVAQIIGTAGKVLDVGIVGPDRGDAVAHTADVPDLSGRTNLSAREGGRVAETSYVVQWRNRENASPADGADRAGEHFVVVSLVSDDQSSVPVPFSLVTEVLGEVDGEPTYLEAGEQPAAATQEARSSSEAGTDQSDDESSAEADPTEDASAAAPAEDGDARLLTLIWVLAGLGLVVALVGGYLLVRGRRFST
ncbi:vWA domain-containing protein [Serinicoccus sp. CNJ-927]|uniref:vWA domain-containing protein n=1 Tax=Serinicoccus sp. CNJ-927 TaxID=1904970 RepID=UPI0013014A70|nr:VWA domain-containing protein [Serinicoccus sp. CNJ-927]